MREEDYKKYIKMISEGKFEEATDFRRATMPRYIYKFYPLTSKSGRGQIDKRTFDTLQHNQVWCSKIEHFNDPYEGIGLYFEYNKKTEAKLASILRVACFAEEAKSNISMWAYYANNHKGFCVKYEVIDNSKLYDINYIEQRKSQKHIWIEALKKTMVGCSTEKELLLIYEKYLTKHISWKNEKEYRIIWATDNDDKYGRLAKCDDLGIRPMEIYAGVQCSDKAKKRLDSISIRLGCGHIKECSISDSEFLVLNE